MSQMSKIIGAAVAISMMVAAIFAWSKFIAVKPEAAAVATAAAVDDPPTISPFDTMIKRGKSLPVEDWRPAN